MCQYCFNCPAWPINQATPERAEPIPELEAEALREALERLISEDKAFEVPEVIAALAAACMQTGWKAAQVRMRLNPSHPRTPEGSNERRPPSAM